MTTNTADAIAALDKCLLGSSGQATALVSFDSREDMSFMFGVSSANLVAGTKFVRVHQTSLPSLAQETLAKARTQKPDLNVDLQVEIATGFVAGNEFACGPKTVSFLVWKVDGVCPQGTTVELTIGMPNASDADAVLRKQHTTPPLICSTDNLQTMPEPGGRILKLNTNCHEAR